MKRGRNFTQATAWMRGIEDDALKVGLYRTRPRTRFAALV